MFLALKNGLGRLAVFFRGLFDEYGGAAAAYSLRRLGSAYSGPLVRVRRDSDDAELDFTSTTQIADWVNGQQETTLPADVATSSAAFSLRKVKDTYTGDAVRIRRASDDVEVNVAFDINGAVSASSAITNVEDISLISESSFATDTGGFESSISGANFSFGNTLDGRSNVLFASFDGAGLLGLNFLTSDVAIGDVVVYSFDVYWESTNVGELPDLRIRSGNTTIGHVDVPMPSKDSWYTFSGQFTVTNNTPAALTLIAANSSGLTTGDIFAIANGSYSKKQDAGNTTATTLGGFLTEELTAYSSDFTTTDGWFGSSTLITANVDANADGAGVPPSDDFLKMVANNRLSLRGNTDVNNYVIAAGGGDFEVTFDYYAPQDISVFKIITFTGSGNPQFGDNDQIVTGSGSWSTTVTLTDAQATTLTDFRVGATTDQTGKTLYIKNLKIKRSNHNAYVHTWYDQSGSGNNATQDTTDDQPKIAEEGALITTLGKPAINFAVGQLLFTNSLIVSLSTNSASVFAVSSQSSLSTTTSYVLQEPDSNISSNFIMGGVANGGVLWVNATEFGTMQTGQTLSGFDWNQSTFQAHINGAASGASGTATVNAEFGNRTGIGGFGGGVGRFQGFMQEIITYKSDQSSNRFKIESNINNYYGIYTASHNGFVHTWYDQSGNSNHAVQLTLLNQPKIVSNGSYLEEIDFDGSDDGLATTSNLTDTLQSLTMFAVTQDDSTSGTASMVRCRPNGSPGDFDGFSWEKETSDTYGANTLLEGVNGMVAAPNEGLGTRTTSENLNTLVYQQSQILAYENGTLDATLSNVRTGSVPVGDVTLVDQLWIGQNFDDNARPFDGSMKEIVIYFSDQSSNRSGIESNIADEYGITLP